MGYLYQNKDKAGRVRSQTWMMQFYPPGSAKPVRKSTGTADEKKAAKILAAAETDTDRGAPTTAAIGKLTVHRAAADLLTDYRNNDYDTVDDAKGRLNNHLIPFFGDRTRMTTITTAWVKAYIAARREAEAANGTINRELALLKRMFVLAIEGGLLLYRPYIPTLVERNVRKGFFEYEAFVRVRAALPVALQGIVTVAYLTGWRVDSEILPLEWRHVDFAAGELRLEADETKNETPRTFPLTGELRTVFEAQRGAADAVVATGELCPWVFFRMVAAGRGGLSPQHRAHAAVVARPKRIKRFDKAWTTACTAAGYGDKIPHDFRRTAVRNMVRRGVPERVAMDLAGHKTRAVFDRYNIVSPADLRAARINLEGLAPIVNDLTDTFLDTTAALATPAASKVTKSLRKFGGAARI